VVDEKGAALQKKMGAVFSENLKLAASILEGISAAEWTAEKLTDPLKNAAEAKGMKLGDLMQPIRVALTGSTVSEPVNELLAVVGRDASLAAITTRRKDLQERVIRRDPEAIRDTLMAVKVP
jgi:glutamyl-tRNA synthetase